jgi:hypothetical protein
MVSDQRETTSAFEIFSIMNENSILDSVKSIEIYHARSKRELVRGRNKHMVYQDHQKAIDVFQGRLLLRGTLPVFRTEFPVAEDVHSPED